MVSSSSVTSPLPQERELLLGDYESYLHRWSFQEIGHRLAVARDLLRWWQQPLDQLRPEALRPYLASPSPVDEGYIRTFTLFLERTGRLPIPPPADPADLPLPEVALPAARLVSDFLRACKRKGQSLRNRHEERYRLGYFLHTLSPERQADLAQVTHHDIEAFIEQQQDRKLTAATINRRLCTLSSFFGWLQRTGYYGRDHPVRSEYCLFVPDPLPRDIPADEVRRFLAVIQDVMDRAIFLVLLRTGIRVGELLRLTASDFDPVQATLTIRVGGKNGEGRVAYLASDAQAALALWLKEGQSFNVKPLFFTRKSQGLCRNTVESRFRRYLKLAGIERPYTVHCLRHTFATALLNAGVPITTLQKLLGHGNIAITQRYARVSDVTKREQYFAAMARIQGVSHGR